MKRRFNRFELKYVVRSDRRDALVRELAERMGPDAHGDAAGAYRVTSLYYDSPDLAGYRAKIDGIKFRRKVRVRTYGRYLTDPRAPVAVEIKQRINRTVQKRRVSLPLDDAWALLAREREIRLPSEDEQSIVGELVFLADTLQLRPTCVISYLREAWVGSRHEPGLRVTFDGDLVVRAPEHGLGPGAPERRFAPADTMILEVKVDEAVPLWVTRMLARHDCSLRRVSKYCAGLARLRGLTAGAWMEGGRPWTS